MGTPVSFCVSYTKTKVSFNLCFKLFEIQAVSFVDLLTLKLLTKIKCSTQKEAFILLVQPIQKAV